MCGEQDDLLLRSKRSMCVDMRDESVDADVSMTNGRLWREATRCELTQITQWRLP